MSELEQIQSTINYLVDRFKYYKEPITLEAIEGLQADFDDVVCMSDYWHKGDDCNG